MTDVSVVEQVLFQYYDAYGALIGEYWSLVDTPPEGTSRILRVMRTYHLTNTRTYVLRDDAGVEVEGPKVTPLDVFVATTLRPNSESSVLGVYDSLVSAKGMWDHFVHLPWSEADSGNSLRAEIKDDPGRYITIRKTDVASAPRS